MHPTRSPPGLNPARFEQLDLLFGPPIHAEVDVGHRDLLFDQDNVNDGEASFLKRQDAHRRDFVVRSLRHPLQVPEGTGCDVDFHGSSSVFWYRVDNLSFGAAGAVT